MLPRLFALALLLPCSAFAAIDFAHQVVPILKEHCADCHLGDKKKGGLSMNTRKDLLDGSENGAVIDLKNASKSLMIDVLTLAGLYTVRLVAGAAATAIPLSFWLLMFAIFNISATCNSGTILSTIAM